jgi:hypothetical protein
MNPTLEKIYAKHDLNVKLEKIFVKAGIPEPVLDLASRIERILATDASFRVPNQESLHAEAQDAAQGIYQSAVDRTLNYAEIQAKKAIRDKKLKKKKLEEEILAVFLLLMADAQEDALKTSYKLLSAFQGAPEDNVPTEQSKSFIEERRPLLSGFPTAVADRLLKVVTDGIASGLSDAEIRAKIALESAALKKGRGSLLSATEAQATYGVSQFWVLRRAGFKTARWITVGDDKVRPSHEACEAAGEVEIGARYPNGLRFPGDPKGPASEVINCRCILIGGSR